MKKAFIFSLLLALVSCGEIANDKAVATHNEHASQVKSESTSTVSSYNSGTETKMTFTSTQNTGDGASNFNGYFSLKAQPAAEINMGFHFEKAGTQIKDTVNTLLFSNFMDLNNVKRIQVDSLDYKEIDEEIKLKFIVTLIKEENDKLKIAEKYSMVYLTGFEDPKPEMVLDKIEKNSIEFVGKTY